jgi:hypothetical protein
MQVLGCCSFHRRAISAPHEHQCRQPRLTMSAACGRSPWHRPVCPETSSPRIAPSRTCTAAMTGPAAHAISASLRRRQAVRIGVETPEERTATTRSRRGGGPSCPPVQHGSCPGNPASRRERMRRGCGRPQAAARLARFEPFAGDEPVSGESMPASSPAPGRSQRPCALHCRPLGQLRLGPHAGRS